ncbi:conjugal transfer protein TraH [Pseudomonas stutzeri]|uniref:conjugal transfer protein TraH n=2 Tax=Gammaproteobacteria TaxID=1236 RepID=UPI001E57D950|nr:conjugal transfer protein TraH [Stutzerimonas stutzeri]
MRINALAFAVAVGIAIPLTASATIEQQVNSMFGQLINVTGPGSYKTASRGVVSGGGIVLRNRITTSNLISITPPSAKGGCGGINLYTGSFSFINGEEFVGLMRNIASNAAGVVSGYAFEAALDYMDASTASIIRGLRNNIQRLNEMFSNSCQLATGVIDAGRKAFAEHNDLKSAATGMLENVTSDFFSSKTATATSPSERLASAGKMKPCYNTGNVMWCGLRKMGIASHLTSGNDEFAELIMSIVGTHILTLKDNDKGGKEITASPIQPTITDRSISLFVDGSKGSDEKVLSCDSDDKEQCLNPSVRTLGSFKGLKQRIIDDVRTSGVFDRLANGTASEADGAKVQYFMSSAVGHNLMRVIQKAGAAEGYIYFEEFAHVIAINAAYAAIMELIDAAHAGLTGVDFAEAEKIKEDLRAARQRVTSEWTKELMNGTNFRDADKRASEILQLAENNDNGKTVQGRQNQGAGS